jgi:tetratricopeptide (TPR) repeat protein
LGDCLGEAQTQNNLGLLYYHEGDLPLAVEFCEKALTTFRVLSDRYGEAQALSNLAVIAEAQGDSSRAVTSYEQSLQICRELGDRSGEGTALTNLCFLLFRQERYDEIGIHAERAWDLAEKLQLYALQTKLCWLSGDLSLAQHDTRAAEDAYSHAMKYAEAVGDVLVQATLDRIHQRQLEIVVGE